jgi:hypothetical protein
MDVDVDLHSLATEQAELMKKLSMLRAQNDKDFVALVESADPTLLSRDEEQLEELLNSPDGNLRCAALCLLDMRNWTGNLASRCQSLAITDPDANVRGVAVLVLRKRYAEIGASRIGALFAQIVLNSHEQMMIRRAAFRAVLEIRGVPLHAKEWRQSLQSDFPAIADLDYVKSWSVQPAPLVP